MKKYCSLLVVLLTMVVAYPSNAFGAHVTKDGEGQESYSLPAAKSGADYEYRFGAEGGLAPLKWRLVGGQLPPGLALLASGTLRGKPSIARREPFIFSLEVSDSSEPPQVFVQSFALSVQAAPLKMVLGTSTLKIVPPESTDRTGPYMDALRSNTQPDESRKTVASRPAASTETASGVASKGESNEAGDDPSTDSPPPPPNILTRLVDGLTLIEGNAEKGATVEIFINNEPADVKKFTALDNGDFDMELTAPLVKGQKVTFQQTVKDVVGIRSVEIIVGDAPGWGRVRTFFSGGVVFSKERDEFSQQDIFLALNVDKNWIKGRKFNFNSYIDVRLTSVPVNVAATAEEDGEGNGNEGDDEDTDNVDTFIASKKAALMQIGFYAPILVGSPRSNNHSFFVAPILKAGIQTITSDFESAEGVNFSGDDVFNFGSAGFRIGHMKFNTASDESHEILSYLDIMRGKWENFEVLLPIPGSTSDDGSDAERPTFRERRWRWGFEGRLKIPLLPLYVGFDANLGDGADDVRFLFGTRFDVGKLFNRLGLLK